LNNFNVQNSNQYVVPSNQNNINNKVNQAIFQQACIYKPNHISSTALG